MTVSSSPFADRPTETEARGALRTNVADRLSEVAARMPEAVAVACPGRGDVAGKNFYATCTFAELEHDAEALARGLVQLGVAPGMRLILLVRPGVEFVKLVFALLRSGATAVLIDPGMGRRHLLACLAAAEPEGFVAVSRAQALRTILRRRFSRARLNVTVGRRWFWGGRTFRQLLRLGQRSSAPLPDTRGDDPAAIIFTSGSTGPPKGVLYTHRMFDTQAAEIRRAYGIQPGGADLACFPLFGLFNAAMGVTTVFPAMDASRPAAADPAKLLTAARDWQVTQAFASPAVWDKLSRYCAEQGERIATLRQVFSCGAPVPADVLRRTLDCVHPEAEMHTPYGATESLPVATISASEVLSETAQRTDQGAGVCVGRLFDSIAWRVIRITDGPLATLDQCEVLPEGEIGELVVRGPQVSPAYVTRTEFNAKTKIADGEAVWHRLGDVGYVDREQRFWYCGRLAHRVQTADGTLFTIPCEAVFNTHPKVRRSALVGVGAAGNQTPMLIVEPTASASSRSRASRDSTSRKDAEQQRLAEELRQLALQHAPTRSIGRFLFRDSLPVDVRHNAKINREALAAEATAAWGSGS